MSASDSELLITLGDLELIPKSPGSPRRLPTLPKERPTSRPLPPIPRALACKRCMTTITSISLLLPLEAIPPESRAFRGFSGKASLFTEIRNVALSKARVRLMATGAHTMQELTCTKCSAYLGWKIVKAFEDSERWKEGHFLMELENLCARIDPNSSPRLRPRHPPRPASSSSEDSSLE
ncbi:hypothetical protein EV361DRAFT_624892 [Lentinula raphanica]|uniref:Yippee domain-containing protein n=1 Tax=Lentinula raphanica TaxID=153919 RepID=A0AA38PA58_9AGAR|nr:hypothetical protein C8R42DRAFT_708621 [Lentinula raphanica]KAJ3762395.1 hypothetical protein EV360DRAFT_79304 [Lentinula raphanica]KAJ3775040.1 hypothetical protein FB446DRAFT_663975 [Lentinula raphanica]KAJ3829096.1 hypothetical protein F5880DRAFT_1620809 [Lentinula raphanica]KAJ3838991.1 hypothetical protein F5878DRAFT_724888 [Lentinula raphanica]